MISFLILVVILLASCLNSILQDAIKNNGKHFITHLIKIILLLVAVYLKSINL